MSVSIREAEADDLEILRALLRDTWHATYDEIYGAEQVEQLTAGWHSIEAMEQRLRRAGTRFLVAERDEEIVGMAVAATEEPNVLFLHQLYVRPDAQGAGVGSVLLEAVLRDFPGTDRVRLDVEVANRPAVEFYERHGFAALGLEAETCVPKMLRMERLLSGHHARPSGHSDAAGS